MMFQQLLNFAWVGVIGFFVNGGVVAALSPSIGPLWAQAIAFPLAVTITWWLNRHYTFSPSGHSLTREWLYYVGANFFGWLVNNGIYFLLVLQSNWFHQYPVAAVAIASIAGMFFNFILSRRFVFSHTKNYYPKEPVKRSFSFWGALSVLTIWPLLLKFPLWSGCLISDPFSIYGRVAAGVDGAILPGSPTIDPNIAFTSDALGRRAAQDWLAGIIPWWNPFEGTGTPLVAEMQGAALFLPFVLLFALPKGQLLFHLSLQIIAGIGSWLLLRRLGMGVVAALCGGMLYEINGTFAWLGNAVINPIAFLPWLLLGVETVAGSVRLGNAKGWSWIPIALAFSLYAGFPEVAYIDGLLAAIWTLIRFVQLWGGQRWLFLFWVMAGVVVGLLLSLPVLVPFFEYLGLAEIGGHKSGIDSVFLPPSEIAAIFFPYLFGPIFLSPDAEIHKWWADVGGFFGLGCVFLALLSLIGQREVLLKVVVLLWILVGLGKAFGLPVITDMMNWLPMMEQAAFYRYVWPSLSMGLVVLAGFSLDDLVNRRYELKWFLAMTLLMLLLVLLALLSSIEAVTRIIADEYQWLSMAGSLLFGGLILTMMISLALIGRTWSMKMLGVVVVLEAAVYFLVPILAYPRRGEMHLAGVEFLSRHLGQQRFYTMGPVAPNYGSAFGIAQLNYNDLPIPKNLTRYTHDHLDPYASPIIFNGSHHPDPKSPSSLRVLQGNLSEYGRSGVSYLITRPEVNLFFQEYEVSVRKSQNVPLELGEGDTLQAWLRLPPGKLQALGIFIGTYRGKSDGILVVGICHQGQCEEVVSDIKLAVDNDFVEIRLPESMVIKERALVEIKVRYVNATKPMAVWLWPKTPETRQVLWKNGNRMEAKFLRMRFSYLDGEETPLQLVYKDEVMKIYRLNRYRSYFSAESCQLQIASRYQVVAQCDVPGTMVRLETFYPGWHAMVNDVPVAIEETEGLFQKVFLPQGRSVVRFWFRPSHYGLIVGGMAVGGMILMAGFFWWRRRHYL